MKKLILAAAAILPGMMLNAENVFRINSVGYLPDDIKVSVFMGDHHPGAEEIVIVAPDGSETRPDCVVAVPSWQDGLMSARIYFSSKNEQGTYTLKGAGAKPVKFYIGSDAYSRNNLNELPLYYLRQQRCGYNPVHDELCHQKDGFLVLSGDRDGEHFDVRGGWHDASDYLQYLTTSANTVYHMLFAYKMNPQVWGDSFDAMGRKGANGIPDILDEARWGLEWMQRMNPEEGLYLNQIADDRDHRYVGTPAKDSVDYGMGHGQDRPVYPCYGKPYGLKGNLNRSTGLASSVAKFASSFGLGAEIFKDIDPEFAADLSKRSAAAYDVAKANPGACQTAPCISPYFYEEDNWADDLELGAIERYKASGDATYLTDAVNYGRLEPVTPWMGADSARHYQWYPFLNLGHYELAEKAPANISREFKARLREGVENVARKGRSNAFLNGIPFVWCSNNFAAAFVTQAMLYRDLTGDNTFREEETAVRDWLFGVNPWGRTMIIGAAENAPTDPHSAMSNMKVKGVPGVEFLAGGLVDGPVYDSIFKSLKGVHLRNEDKMADYQHGRAVYHDDYSDYSTNEPTMDGTASLTYMLGRLAAKANVKK